MKDIIKNQQKICKKFDSQWVNTDLELKIGVADNVFTDLEPINGMRHPQEGDTSGWYIWSGENFSDADDFFKPYCIKHLLELKPEIIKFLGLSEGHRFLIDNNGYEDVWKDENLLNIY